MVKAYLPDVDSRPGEPDESGEGAVGDLYFFAVPASTYRVLSDEAAKRGMTLAQLVQNAFNTYLTKTESDSGSPRLLVE